MALKEMKEMDRKKEVLWSMADLVDPASENFSENPGYTINHVESCSQILDTYIDQLILLGKQPSNDQILSPVQTVVERLNELNAECDNGLIETMERENLCDYIEEAAILAGWQSESGEDITEEWREW